MSDDAYVLSARDEHGVALVRLNRPPMNPLSQAMLAAIRDVARELTDDTTVKAVVFAGSEKAFAAGADIDEFGDQAQAAEIERSFRDAFDALVGRITRRELDPHAAAAELLAAPRRGGTP